MIRMLLACFFCFLSAWPVVAEEAGASSGLPLPRFASLRTNETNMRTGPGVRYPIEWIVKNEGLPVEIILEYDVWRRIKDWEGSEGWVHQNALSGRRTLIITEDGVHEIKKNPKIDAPVIAKVDQWALGRILGCEKTWCEARFGDIEGYVPKHIFWGAYSEEIWK